MKYNFDEVIKRRGSNSLKWDSVADAEVLPMWVALGLVVLTYVLCRL